MAKIEPWVQVIGRLGSGKELVLPFYFVGKYQVSGGNSLEQPQVLGLRQPSYKVGIEAQKHSLQAVAYGWGSPVGGYRDILQQFDSDPKTVVALVFPTDRSIVAPLLIRSWTFEEVEYGLGTGEPVRANVTLELASL